MPLVEIPAALIIPLVDRPFEPTTALKAVTEADTESD